jgi:hypothetical protein
MTHASHPPRPARLLGLVAAGLALLACLASAARAEVYLDEFTNTSGANQSLSYIGWAGYVGSTATTVTGTTPSGNFWIAASNGAGTQGSTSPGVIAALNNDGNARVFTAVKTGLNLTDVGQITFNLHTSQSAAQTVHLLVQVEGSSDWYASTAQFTPFNNFGNFNAATVGQVQRTLSFTTSASAWRDFDLTPDTSLVLGSVSSSALPSSTITGIGFYINSSTTNLTVTRIDDLAVSYTPIPEPSAFAAVAGLGVLSLVALRRRRPAA